MSSRRIFLKNAGIAGAGMLCGISSLSMLLSCTGYPRIEAALVNKSAAFPASDVANRIPALVHVNGLRAPLLLSRSESGVFSAVLMECTHKQCELGTAGSRLVCPCHGSEFSLDGNVLRSPAVNNLKRFRVTEENNQVVIHLSEPL